MKCLYIIIFTLLTCSFLQAQIVNIPDANFKAYLVDAWNSYPSWATACLPGMSTWEISFPRSEEFQGINTAVFTSLYNAEDRQILRNRFLGILPICDSTIFGESLDGMLRNIVVPWYAIKVEKAE